MDQTPISGCSFLQAQLQKTAHHTRLPAEMQRGGANQTFDEQRRCSRHSGGEGVIDIVRF